MERNRHELGAFVRAARQRLSPAELGLPATPRRRTDGLRREEVAARAGVGLTWYTWFEQGRDIGVSEAFLLSVAKALQLDDDECRHLFMLAQRRPPAAEAYQAPTVGDAVQGVLDALGVPGFVLNLKRDLVAWNAAAADLFVGRLARGDNLLRAVFFDPDVRQLMPSWRDDAAALAVAFRRDLAVVPDDPLMRDLDRQLSADVVYRASRDPAGSGAGGYGLSAWAERRFEEVALIADAHRHLRLVVLLDGSTGPAGQMPP